MIIVTGFSDLENSLFLKVAEEHGIDHRCRCLDSDDVPDSASFIRAMRDHGPKLPKIVIINLDNPAWRELVKGLKENEVWRFIPIMAFGFLEDRDAVNDFYAAGGTSCIRKPHGYEGLMKITETAMQYWLDVSFLPNDFLEDVG